jgi:hypothetical protein
MNADAIAQALNILETHTRAPRDPSARAEVLAAFAVLRRLVANA